MSLTARTSRRRVLQGLGASLISAPWIARAQQGGQKLRHAAIGVGGQGNSDLNTLLTHPDLELTAICDVDGNTLNAVAQRFPNVRKYQDWRELFDAEDGRIDSVNVSTPDHSHAIITATALERHLHTYTQKPLTRTVEESRALARMAAERPALQTQMGTQIASDLSNVRVIELFETGVLGKAKEVYLWSPKTWGDPNPLPDREDPVPAHLDWDVWLGVAAMRPYLDGAYHPGNWRKRLDFGTGTLGDMGAHIFHPALAAIRLGMPVEVSSTGPRPNATNWAINEELHYVFEANERVAGDHLKLHWYDGGTLPVDELRPHLGDTALPDQGGLILCEKGALLCPHVGLPTLLPQDQFSTENPRRQLKNHYHEWVDACLGRPHTLRSRFNWGAHLTEIILLGGAASFFPDTKLAYDAQRMSFDHAEANAYLRRDYRDGWEIPQLRPAAAGA